MKNVLLGLCALFLAASASAQPKSLSEALQQAHTAHRQVLLTFSGSDWCIPCIRLEKEVFSDSKFQQYASGNLVRLSADFPRLKKHRLPKEQQAQNDELAAKYNPQGEFPLIVLLDADGKVLHRWTGSNTGPTDSFVAELDALKAR